MRCVLVWLLVAGIRSISADIEFSRTVTSVAAGDSGSVVLASGCTGSDAHGSNDCTLTWGESDAATISGVLAENLDSKARVDVDLKVDGLIPWKFSCSVCGPPCTVTVPVVKKTVTITLPPCPIAKGALTNKTQSFSLPSKSPVPIKVSAKGTATLYDDAGSAVLALDASATVSPSSSLVSPLSQVFIPPDFNMLIRLFEALGISTPPSTPPSDNTKLFKCNTVTAGCNACVMKQLVVAYPCYFCEIDSKCHDVGSLESACTPPSADQKCISLSTFSNCALKSVSDCPANASAI